MDGFHRRARKAFGHLQMRACCLKRAKIYLSGENSFGKIVLGSNVQTWKFSVEPDESLNEERKRK